MKYLSASGTLSYNEGPQSDHRSLYVDIKFAEYLDFDANNNPYLPAIARSLRTGNPELVEGYHAAMKRYYTDHNMVQRIDDLHHQYKKMSIPKIREKLEAWDNDQGRAMRHAESEIQVPRKVHAWSPQLRNAGMTKRYWRLRLHEAKNSGTNYQATISRLQAYIQCNDPTFKFPHINEALPILSIRQHLNAATKHLQAQQKQALSNRFKTYRDLLATYTNDTNPITRPESNRKAKIVKRTMRTERIRRMFHKIRTTAKHILPSSQSGLHQVKIPVIPDQNPDNKHHPEQFQDFISCTPAESIEWETEIDRDKVEEYLLQYNKQSFRAAAESPCGHGTIYNAITFNSLSHQAKEFLYGKLPKEWHNDDHLLQELLRSFQIPDKVKQMRHIKTSMSAEDIAKGISGWKEKTSTSPSGRHLGHYKAIIKDDTLLQCLTKFMHVAIKSGIAIRRWSQATNVMLEKDPGRPLIHRLRIIHLFEADFNLYMKCQWGKRLVQRAAKHNLLNSGQFGSVPNHTSTEPIMLTQLTNDICRTTKTNLARVDNNASACFDRIIVPLAMLAARRCGMSEASVRIHADTLERMEYSVKTSFGISEKSYSGTIKEPLFGTGQGSGASPAAWLSLVVLLMNTMDRVVHQRVSFSSPDSKMDHTRLIDAFVDDTSLSYTNNGTQTYEEMVATIEQIAGTWERLAPVLLRWLTQFTKMRMAHNVLGVEIWTTHNASTSD
jgi:DNA-binding transcriptional MerR regulator